MFDNKRYVTRGIKSTLPQVITSFLWCLIDEIRQTDHEVDYLQVFNLWEDKDSIGTPIQVIKHSQEVPEYEAIYNLYLPIKPIISKVYIVDSISYSTMLLAEEY